MAIEIAPSMRGGLVFLGVLVVVVVWLYSSGSLLTLAFLALVVGLLLYLTWILGVRVTRRLLGV